MKKKPCIVAGLMAALLGLPVVGFAAADAASPEPPAIELTDSSADTAAAEAASNPLNGSYWLKLSIDPYGGLSDEYCLYEPGNGMDLSALGTYAEQIDGFLTSNWGDSHPYTYGSTATLGDGNEYVFTGWSGSVSLDSAFDLDDFAPVEEGDGMVVPDGCSYLLTFTAQWVPVDEWIETTVQSYRINFIGYDPADPTATGNAPVNGDLYTSTLAEALAGCGDEFSFEVGDVVVGSDGKTYRFRGYESAVGLEETLSDTQFHYVETEDMGDHRILHYELDVTLTWEPTDDYLKADKTELKAQLDAAYALANSIDRADYPEDIAQALADAIDAAQNVWDDAAATQEEVDRALEDLRTACDDIEDYDNEYTDLGDEGVSSIEGLEMSMEVAGARRDLNALTDRATGGLRFMIDAAELTDSEKAFIAGADAGRALGSYEVYIQDHAGKIIGVEPGDGLSITVRLSLTDEMRAALAAGEDLTVWYLADDGAAMSSCETWVEDGTLCFRTDHLSTFVLFASDGSDDPTDDGTDTKPEDGPGTKPGDDDGDTDDGADGGKDTDESDDGLPQTGDAGLVAAFASAAGALTVLAGGAAARRRR